MAPTTTTKPYGVRISQYFEHIKGEYYTEDIPDKKDPSISVKQKVFTREPEPPTLTGLALCIGFTSLEAFEAYEKNGRFAAQLKMGRLMIEAEYEKRLHYQSATGAIFALKMLGWKEHQDDAGGADQLKNININIIVSGPAVAGTEKDVAL